MRTAAIILVSCLASLAVQAPATAGTHSNRGAGTEPAAEMHVDGPLSLEQAVARAERRYAARAVRAEEHREGNRTVYRIRLLTADGRVIDVTVDPASGEIR
jgi:uncharacterized membrane protein YkoI